jgi:photosystem II stability/assembly factor-like uncharacterized protein
MKKHFTLIIILTTIFWSSCKKDTTPSTSNSIDILEDWVVTKRAHNLSINYRDLFFANSNVGFVVGYNGAIYNTSNAGQIWQKQNSNTTLHLFSIHFVNAQIGYASGQGMRGCLDPDCNKGAILLRTSNGGETWAKKFFPNYESIKALHFIDQANGFAIISTPYVLGARNFHIAKTIDGGENWELIDLDIKNYEDKLYIIDNTIFVPGGNQKLFKSVDFGNSWKSIQPPSISWGYIRSMHFYDSQLGFIDGGGNKFKTKDGGLHWEIVSIPMETLDMFHCYSEMEWFGLDRTYELVGSGTIDFIGSTGVQTFDEGIHWKKSKLYSNVSIYRYHFPKRDIGFGMDNTDFYTIRRK